MIKAIFKNLSNLFFCGIVNIRHYFVTFKLRVWFVKWALDLCSWQLFTLKSAHGLLRRLALAVESPLLKFIAAFVVKCPPNNILWCTPVTSQLWVPLQSWACVSVLPYTSCNSLYVGYYSLHANCNCSCNIFCMLPVLFLSFIVLNMLANLWKSI